MLYATSAAGNGRSAKQHLQIQNDKGPRRSISKRQHNAHRGRRKTILPNHRGQSAASQIEGSIFGNNTVHSAYNSKRKRSISSQRRWREEQFLKQAATNTEQHQLLMHQIHGDKSPSPIVRAAKSRSAATSPDRPDRASSVCPLFVILIVPIYCTYSMWFAISGYIHKKKHSNFPFNSYGRTLSRPVSPLRANDTKSGKSRSNSSGDVIHRRFGHQNPHHFPIKSTAAATTTRRKASDSLSDMTRQHTVHGMTRDLFTRPKAQSRRQSMVNGHHNGHSNGQLMASMMLMMFQQLPMDQRLSLVQSMNQSLNPAVHAATKASNFKIGTFPPLSI